LKRPSRYYFFSICLILLSCAPREIPPPRYEGAELTLEELISKARDGTKSIKAIVEINVTKDNLPYHHSIASIIIKEGGIAHMRLYNLGMLTGDLIVKEGEVYVLQGRISKRLKPFIKEFYDTVFWWDGLRGGYMHKDNDVYIIRTDKRILHVDSATLLPIKQQLMVNDEVFYMIYDVPRREGDFWYPSYMEIKINEYRLSVRVKRLLINPKLSDSEFREP